MMYLWPGFILGYNSFVAINITNWDACIIYLLYNYRKSQAVGRKGEFTNF